MSSPPASAFDARQEAELDHMLHMMEELGSEPVASRGLPPLRAARGRPVVAPTASVQQPDVTPTFVASTRLETLALNRERARSLSRAGGAEVAASASARSDGGSSGRLRAVPDLPPLARTSLISPDSEPLFLSSSSTPIAVRKGSQLPAGVVVGVGSSRARRDATSALTRLQLPSLRTGVAFGIRVEIATTIVLAFLVAAPIAGAIYVRRATDWSFPPSTSAALLATDYSLEVRLCASIYAGVFALYTATLAFCVARRRTRYPLMPRPLLLAALSACCAVALVAYTCARFLAGWSLEPSCDCSRVVAALGSAALMLGSVVRAWNWSGENERPEQKLAVASNERGINSSPPPSVGSTTIRIRTQQSYEVTVQASPRARGSRADSVSSSSLALPSPPILAAKWPLRERIYAHVVVGARPSLSAGSGPASAPAVSPLAWPNRRSGCCSGEPLDSWDALWLTLGLLVPFVVLLLLSLGVRPLSQLTDFRCEGQGESDGARGAWTVVQGVFAALIASGMVAGRKSKDPFGVRRELGCILVAQLGLFGVDLAGVIASQLAASPFVQDNVASARMVVFLARCAVVVHASLAVPLAKSWSMHAMPVELRPCVDGDGEVANAVEIASPLRSNASGADPFPNRRSSAATSKDNDLTASLLPYPSLVPVADFPLSADERSAMARGEFARDDAEPTAEAVTLDFVLASDASQHFAAFLADEHAAEFAAFHQALRRFAVVAAGQRKALAAEIFTRFFSERVLRGSEEFSQAMLAMTVALQREWLDDARTSDPSAFVGDRDALSRVDGKLRHFANRVFDDDDDELLPPNLFETFAHASHAVMEAWFFPRFLRSPFYWRFITELQKTRILQNRRA